MSEAGWKAGESGMNNNCENGQAESDETKMREETPGNVDNQ